MLSNPLDNPKLFRHVLEDLPVGIHIVDGERRIRSRNHGAENPTDITGKPNPAKLDPGKKRPTTEGRPGRLLRVAYPYFRFLIVLHKPCNYNASHSG